MTLGGWLVMMLSVGTVSSLFFWCIYRISVEKSTGRRPVRKQDADTPDPGSGS